MKRLWRFLQDGLERVRAWLARSRPLQAIGQRIRGGLRRRSAARAAHQPPFTPAPSAIERVIAWLRRFRWLRPLMEGILPSPRLLKDETIQLEIRMAPYRVQATYWFFRAALALVAFSLLVTVLLVVFRAPILLQALGGILIFLSISLLLQAIHQILLYYQWRFILTNKRTIIIAPDARRRGFADAVYLKGGRIQVVDTAWSSSPVWGFFQATTGARDVILSLAGYEFRPEGAEVKGGLRFPDVMPDDIIRLEELIFG